MTTTLTATGATAAPIRHHRVPGTYNLRDAGGYAAAHGQLRWGKLFRSDGLHRLSDDGREAVRALGIGLVVDLRDVTELEREPSRLEGVGAQTVHAPIFEGAAPDALVTESVTLAAIYDTIIDSYGANVVRAVRLIAGSGDTPVLVHCTAGKDRTGLVIALAQLAAGVARTDVVADYAATEANLRGEWLEYTRGRMAAHGVPDSDALQTIMGASPAELLEALLDRIDREHGSATAYLQANGLSTAELGELRLALIGGEPVATDTASSNTASTDTASTDKENAA